MQLKLDALGRLVVERVAVAAFRSLIGQQGQVVGFELYAVEFVVAAELLYLFLALFAAHHLVAVLVAGKFVEQVFF